MKATVTPINQRINLQLNVALPFEALILKRLVRVPRDRRDEWLRGLLVQGFKCECGDLKDVQCDNEIVGNAAPAQNIVAHPYVSAAKIKNPISGAGANPQTEAPDIKPQHCGNTVSFDSLRKVIG